MVLCHQGYNSLTLDRVADAHASFVEALRLARNGGYLPFALDALVGFALVSAKHSSDERTLELLQPVLQHPATPSDAKSRAEGLCAELEARLTPQQIQAARAEAQEQSIDKSSTGFWSNFSPISCSRIAL